MTMLKNHKNALSSLAMAVALSLTAGTAIANQTYVLDNVKFNDGTSLTGYFTTNIYGYMASVDITSVNGHILGYNYDLSIPSISNDVHAGDNSSGVNGSTTIVDIERTNPSALQYTSDLHLVFDTPLGGGINAIDDSHSYECLGSFQCGINQSIIPASDIRLIASGDVVPEPASIALLGVGVLGLIAFVRRRSV